MAGMREVFTLGQYVASHVNPYRGNEVATRAMLVQMGIPFFASMMIPTQKSGVRGNWFLQNGISESGGSRESS